jgi:hypothetical protein
MHLTLGRSERFKIYDSTGTIRLVVHFEKKGGNSVLIKPDNLHMAFELPNEGCLLEG